MNRSVFPPLMRLATAVVTGPTHLQRRTDLSHRVQIFLLSHHRHQSFSALFSSSIPKISETFFCSSTNPSARSARRLSRKFSRSNSRTLSANGFFSRRCGPRLFAVNPANSPRSRCLRQFVRLDQYKPSRRSSAPISPLCLQLSASRKTSSLYSAVNRRRSPLAKTSTSLEDIAPLLPVSISHSLLALYTKLLAGQCLIHICREGSERSPSARALCQRKRGPLGKPSNIRERQPRA